MNREYLAVVQRASQLIQSTRTEMFFEQASRFTQLWSETLRIPPGHYLTLSANISASIDYLFEECASEEALASLVQDLQILTDPKSAIDYLMQVSEHEHLHQALDHPTALKLHVAHLTEAGCQHILKTLQDATLLNLWLKFWQTSMFRQNSQQREYCKIGFTLDEYRPPTAPVEEALESYLTQFSETGALAVAVYSVIPYSTMISQDLLESIGEILSYLVPLFRLAQDTIVDLQEPFNAGIFAYAAQHNLSLKQARDTLKTNLEELQALEDSIKTYTTYHHTVTQKAIYANLLEKNNQENEALKSFTGNLLFVAGKLTDKWR